MMSVYFDTFYPVGPDSSGGPRVVRLLWGEDEETSALRYRAHGVTCLAMMDDVVPLLNIRACWTSVCFEVALEGTYRAFDASDLRHRGLAERYCHILGFVIQHDNPTWLTAIRESVFDSIQIHHIPRYTPLVIQLELGEARPDEVRSFAPSPYQSTRWIRGIGEALGAIGGVQILSTIPR